MLHGDRYLQSLEATHPHHQQQQHRYHPQPQHGPEDAASTRLPLPALPVLPIYIQRELSNSLQEVEGALAPLLSEDALRLISEAFRVWLLASKQHSDERIARAFSKNPYGQDTAGVDRANNKVTTWLRRSLTRQRVHVEPVKQKTENYGGHLSPSTLTSTHLSATESPASSVQKAMTTRSVSHPADVASTTKMQVKKSTTMTSIASVWTRLGQHVRTALGRQSSKRTLTVENEPSSFSGHILLADTKSSTYSHSAGDPHEQPHQQEQPQPQPQPQQQQPLEQEKGVQGQDMPLPSGSMDTFQQQWLEANLRSHLATSATTSPSCTPSALSPLSSAPSQRRSTIMSAHHNNSNKTTFRIPRRPVPNLSPAMSSSTARSSVLLRAPRQHHPQVGSPAIYDVCSTPRTARSSIMSTQRMSRRPISMLSTLRKDETAVLIAPIPIPDASAQKSDAPSKSQQRKRTSKQQKRKDTNDTFYDYSDIWSTRRSLMAPPRSVHSGCYALSEKERRMVENEATSKDAWGPEHRSALTLMAQLSNEGEMADVHLPPLTQQALSHYPDDNSKASRSAAEEFMGACDSGSDAYDDNNGEGDEEEEEEDGDIITPTFAAPLPEKYMAADVTLKTPWSPPLGEPRRAQRRSAQHRPASPQLNAEDEYLQLAQADKAFQIEWQMTFHDEWQSQERMEALVRWISFSLCSKLRESHAQERFLYDDIFTAHPDLVASSNSNDRKQLFGAEATTAWFDIYDMIAYVFDCGTLVAEHGVIAMIYIERMLETSGQPLCDANWRLVTLMGLMLSVKIWDDCAVFNADFVQIFPDIDLSRMNLVERHFLHGLKYNIGVSCKEFATTFLQLQRQHDKATN